MLDDGWAKGGRREKAGTLNEKFAHLFAFDVRERRARRSTGGYIISLNSEGCR